MKLKLTLLTVLAGLGLATTQAQQPVDQPPASKPPPPPEKPAPNPHDRERPQPPADSRRSGDPNVLHFEWGPRGENAPRGEQKPMPYMGVVTREVSPELRSQFSLPEGYGLMVDEVMKDSPAAQAGIKVHDILVKLGDQQLVNMEQLMTLVRGKKKGESVSLSIITGGKESQVSVTLGERMMPVADQRQEAPRNGLGWPQQMQTFRMGGPAGGNMFMPPGGAGAGGIDTEDIQKAVREYQERVQQWMRDGQRGPMPAFPQMQMPQMPGFQPGGGNQRRDGGKSEHREERSESRSSDGNSSSRGSASAFGGGGKDVQIHIDTNTASHIVRRDESGEYSLKREDGKATFTVRPNNGKEQSWPVNNDQERAAIPQEFRDKLKMFDNMPGQPRMTPPGGGNPPAPPAPGATDKPKGQTTSA